MSQPKRKLLSEFSIEELRAELETRVESKVGIGWYFYEEDEDEFPEDEVRFSVCPIRYYHLNGHFYDGSVTHYLKLPKKFYESMESTFEYKGTKVEGRKVLLDLGFTEFPNTHGGLLVHVIKVTDQPGDECYARWHYQCDTAKIKEHMAVASAAYSEFSNRDRGIFDSLAEYKAWIRGLLKPGWMIITNSEHRGSGAGTIIEESVFQNLPPYPPNLFRESDDNDE